MNYSDFLGGAFRIPHDRPPRRLLVFTAYLDESGQEQRENYMFVAGYVGDERAWARVAEPWLAAIHPRKHLHMKNLRFARESERKMLIRAASVSKECGLTPVLGGVRGGDYMDLIAGTEDERKLAGYVTCCFALIINTVRNIPKNERLEIVFQRQDRYWPLVEVAIAAIAQSRYWPEMLTTDGRSKIATWRLAPQGEEEGLTELADCFSYSLFQAWRDKSSRRSQWCKPILDAHEEGYGRILKREEIRGIVQDTLMVRILADARKLWKAQG
jgi:hypothetical protein